MKKQIIAIVSILVLSTLAQAALCTAESISGTWGQDSNESFAGDSSCGNSTFVSTTRYFLPMNNGVIEGFATAKTVQTYSKGCKGMNSKIEFPKVELKVGRLYVTDKEGTIRSFSCSVSDDGSTLVFNGDGYLTRLGGKAGTSARKTNNNISQEAKDLGDWAQPADKNTQYSKREVQAPPQAVKQQAAAPRMVQPSARKSDPALGDWAPVAQ
ncbi:hypothetical protein CIK05_07400 [Bdellovibrio sp. qaytius]|nr:hypothetical protein CIK05_07400 [Bdellovibrio sp. qaytius]